MRKKILTILTILLIILLSIVLVAWQGGDVERVREERLGYPFSMHIGDEVMVRDTEDASGRIFFVRFLEVAEDSRCALDAQCVWAGRAVVHVGLRINEGEEVVHPLSTERNEPVLFDAHGTIRLISLQPAPLSSYEIDASEYVATFSLSHA